MTHAKKVGLVHAEELYRSGLAKMLQDGAFELRCAKASLDDLLQHPDADTLDLVVLALTGDPERRVRFAVETLRARLPECKVVTVSQRSAVGTMLEAFNAGADGAVHSEFSAQAFVDSLALVMSGEQVYPSFMLRELMRAQEDHHDKSPEPRRRTVLDQLSASEKSVLQHLIRGLTNKEIAHASKLSEASVKVHLRRICRLTKMHNRTEVALWAAKHLQNDLAKDDGERVRKSPGQSSGYRAA